MFVRKIPRRFLIHTVNLAEVETAAGAFGGITVTKGAEIKNVRLISTKSEINISRDNEQYKISDILIYQPDVSTPCTFQAGGHILRGEKLYKIAEVKELYEAERLHHLEVMLCR